MTLVDPSTLGCLPPGVHEDKTDDVLDLLFDHNDGILKADVPLSETTQRFASYDSDSSPLSASTLQTSPHSDSGFSDQDLPSSCVSPPLPAGRSSTSSMSSVNSVSGPILQQQQQHTLHEEEDILTELTGITSFPTSSVEIPGFDVDSFMEQLEAGVGEDLSTPTLEHMEFVSEGTDMTTFYVESVPDDSRYSMEIGQEVQVHSSPANCSQSCRRGAGAAPGPMRTTGRAAQRKRCEGLPYSVKDLDPDYRLLDEDSVKDEDDTDISCLEGAPGDRLVLTAEEKRILGKESLTLPTHLPLTREEERILKMVRRKIRNKISAKNSRLKKQEYVAGLEQRVKKCTQENNRMQKSIDRMEKENFQLRSTVRRMQAALASLGVRISNSGHKASAVGGTGLFVLVLSFVVFLGPQTTFWTGQGSGGELAGSGVTMMTSSSRSLKQVDMDGKSVRPGLPWDMPPKPKTPVVKMTSSETVSSDPQNKENRSESDESAPPSTGVHSEDHSSFTYVDDKLDATSHTPTDDGIAKSMDTRTSSDEEIPDRDHTGEL